MVGLAFAKKNFQTESLGFAVCAKLSVQTLLHLNLQFSTRSLDSCNATKFLSGCFLTMHFFQQLLLFTFPLDKHEK